MRRTIQKERRARRPLGAGLDQGKNLRIDWHWTAGDVGRIRGDVTELAGHPPDIIVANGRVTLSEAVQVIRSIPKTDPR